MPPLRIGPTMSPVMMQTEGWRDTRGFEQEGCQPSLQRNPGFRPRSPSFASL